MKNSPSMSELEELLADFELEVLKCHDMGRTAMPERKELATLITQHIKQVALELRPDKKDTFPSNENTLGQYNYLYNAALDDWTERLERLGE